MLAAYFSHILFSNNSIKVLQRSTGRTGPTNANDTLPRPLLVTLDVMSRYVTSLEHTLQRAAVDLRNTCPTNLLDLECCTMRGDLAS
jgi:hypothetical protein